MSKENTENERGQEPDDELITLKISIADVAIARDGIGNQLQMLNVEFERLKAKIIEKKRQHEAAGA